MIYKLKIKYFGREKSDEIMEADCENGLDILIWSVSVVMMVVERG